MPEDLMRTKRDVLDGPPAQPRMRNAPKTGLRVLSGGKDQTTPDDDDDESLSAQNSPEGMHDESEDPESELNNHPVVQVMQLTGQIQSLFDRMSVLAPEIAMVIADLTGNLRQIVPQWASMKLSGAAAGAPMATGTPTQAPVSAGPPPMGLQQLAGGGAGGPATAPGTVPGGPMM